MSDYQFEKIEVGRQTTIDLRKKGSYNKEKSPEDLCEK